MIHPSLAAQGSRYKINVSIWASFDCNNPFSDGILINAAIRFHVDNRLCSRSKVSIPVPEWLLLVARESRVRNIFVCFCRKLFDGTQISETGTGSTKTTVFSKCSNWYYAKFEPHSKTTTISLSLLPVDTIGRQLGKNYRRLLPCSRNCLKH